MFVLMKEKGQKRATGSWLLVLLNKGKLTLRTHTPFSFENTHPFKEPLRRESFENTHPFKEPLRRMSFQNTHPFKEPLRRVSFQNTHPLRSRQGCSLPRW